MNEIGIKNYKFKGIDMKIEEVSHSALLNTFPHLPKKTHKRQKTPHKATLYLLFLLKEIHILCIVNTALELFQPNFRVQLYKSTRVVFQG